MSVVIGTVVQQKHHWNCNQLIMEIRVGALGTGKCVCPVVHAGALGGALGTGKCVDPVVHAGALAGALGWQVGGGGDPVVHAGALAGALGTGKCGGLCGACWSLGWCTRYWQVW